MAANLELQVDISKPKVPRNRVIPRSFWVFKFFMHKVKIGIVEAVYQPATKKYISN